MRILHVIESMNCGGAERNLASLLGPLSGMGAENYLATLRPGRHYEDRVAAFVQRHEFNINRTSLFMKALPGLVRLAAKVDVVHTQLPWANVVGRLAALAAGRPSVTTLHSTAYDDANVARLVPSIRRKTRILRHMDAITARTTRHFFAVSPRVKEVSTRSLHIPTGQIEVAPCCLDPRDFNPESVGSQAEVRAELGWRPGDFIVLSVGRLIPSKRQADAIKAVARAARTLPMHLYLAGVGRDEMSLRSLINELKAPVTMLGLRTDIPRLLRGADLFVFPSEYEGMPLALLEAMAMGLPCVCSDIDENTSLTGDSSVYFPVGDVEALAEALLVLRRDDARLRRMSMEHRSIALRHADPTAAARRFLRSIRTTLGTNGHALAKFDVG